MSSRRSLWTTFAATGTLFLALAVLLGVQMALGRDPSMGHRTANRAAPGEHRHRAQVPAGRPAAPQQDETSGGGSGDQYGGQAYDDGSGYGYPQQPAPQQPVPQQQSAPLQSGTS